MKQQKHCQKCMIRYKIWQHFWNQKYLTLLSSQRSRHLQLGLRGPAGPPGPSRLPGRSHESQSTQSSSEETNSHPAQPRNICSKKKKTPYLEKPKVLYIGDSVAHNANFAHIEKDTKSSITTVKSYRTCLMLLQLLERKRRKKMNLTI